MKLKPCPRCGKSPKKLGVWKSYPGNKYHVECPGCHWCSRPSRILWFTELSWNRGKKK